MQHPWSAVPREDIAHVSGDRSRLYFYHFLPLLPIVSPGLYVIQQPWLDSWSASEAKSPKLGQEF